MTDTHRVRLRVVFDIELPKGYAYLSSDDVRDAAVQRLEDSLGQAGVPHSVINGVEIEGRWYEPVPWAKGEEPT